MIRRPPRSTPLYSSAASDVYKRQARRRRLDGTDGDVAGVPGTHAWCPMTRRALVAVAVMSGLSLAGTAAGLVCALEAGRLEVGGGGLLAFAAIAVIGLLIAPATRLRGAGAFTWVFAAVFAVDQATKFVGWRWADFQVINAGADGIIDKVSPIYVNPATGAGMDV